MPEPSTNPNLEAELWDQPSFRIAMRDAAVEVVHLANTFIKEVHRDRGSVSWIPSKGHSAPVEVVQQDGGRTLYVSNFDHGAALQEWGGAKHPPFAPLRRAVRAAGLDLRETPK